MVYLRAPLFDKNSNSYLDSFIFNEILHIYSPMINSIIRKSRTNATWITECYPG